MTTTHTKSNNLLFLLAAAPMGMGCIIVADDTDETTAADTGNQTSGQTTEALTETSSNPPPGTDEGPTTGTGSFDESTGTGSTGADVTGPDSTGDETTGGGAAGCAAYGAAAIKCEVPYAEYVEISCGYALEYNEMYSAECGVAYEEYVACLSELSCEELTGEAPCMTQLDALLALGCPAVE